MTSVDGARWDARYAGRPPAVPAPPDGLVAAGDDPLADAVLVTLLASVPANGVVLDVACGLGAQTVWAAQTGRRVVALDASPLAVAATSTLAAAHGVAARVTAVVHDLTGDRTAPGPDGLPAVVPAQVDLVICQRYRQPSLYPVLADRLRPAGGIAVVTVLSSLDAEDPGPFHAPPGELVTVFGSMPAIEIVRAVEARGTATIVIRRR